MFCSEYFFGTAGFGFGLPVVADCGNRGLEGVSWPSVVDIQVDGLTSPGCWKVPTQLLWLGFVLSLFRGILLQVLCLQCKVPWRQVPTIHRAVVNGEKGFFKAIAAHT
jgi:hypothetical protein